MPLVIEDERRPIRDRMGRGGYLEPSDAPGIGVELNEEEMARHPYGQDKFLRLFEEGWERRER